jgi:uncharacterized membrane protein YeaQ/YmgE (transglycosylase-associated protein family)
MSATLINLIIQLIAGAVGGNAAGGAIKNVDLGTLGNTIAGALGGAGGVPGSWNDRQTRQSRANVAAMRALPKTASNLQGALDGAQTLHPLFRQI